MRALRMVDRLAIAKAQSFSLHSAPTPPRIAAAG
jgi:hypothetical protein